MHPHLTKRLSAVFRSGRTTALLLPLCATLFAQPTYVFTSLAGAGTSGDADGVGLAARFNAPGHIAVDHAGNVFVADTGNFTIRKITADGEVTTLAGMPGQSGNTDGTGSAARFGEIGGIAVDGAGNVYVSDSTNWSIRKVSWAGVVTTLAGSVKGSVDGTGAAAQFGVLRGLDVDSAGNVYVAQVEPTAIRKITPVGAVTTVSHGEPKMPGPLGTSFYFYNCSDLVATDRHILPSPPALIWVADEGRIGYVAGAGAQIIEYQRLDDAPAVVGELDQLRGISSLAEDLNGNLFAVDTVTKTVGRLPPLAGALRRSVAEISSEDATSGGSSKGEMMFEDPFGVEVDSAGNLYVSDRGRHVIYKGVPVVAESSTRLKGISVRSRAGAGDRTVIMGFAIEGAGERRILVRGVGPGLAGFGVTDRLADPQLRIYDASAQQIAENEDWASTLGPVMAELGHTPFQTDSKDAAVILPVASGGFTAHLSSSGVTSGVGLLEVYDADTTGENRIKALAARSHAGVAESTLIAGFILTGDSPKRILLRGVGPALAQQGVTEVLNDPVLALFRGSEKIASNDNWDGALALEAAFSAAGLSSFGSDTSKDAALIAYLDPGVYTVHVAGADGGSGVALVEIYEIE